jgi:long-subunit fatty acid transport protein
MESSYSLILSQADLTVLSIGGVPPSPETADADIAREALTGASFATWRLNETMVLGLAITSPWGLGSKPDNSDWAGKPLAATTKLISPNVTLSVSYEILPSLAVGAGVQVEYFDVLRQTASIVSGTSSLTSNLTGDDLGVGFTAGLNLRPASGTSIGLGFGSDHADAGSAPSASRSAARFKMRARCGGADGAVAAAAVDTAMPDRRHAASTSSADAVASGSDSPVRAGGVVRGTPTLVRARIRVRDLSPPSNTAVASSNAAQVISTPPR